MKIKFQHAASDPLFRELRRRVDEYFVINNLSKHANSAMILKTVVLLALYLGPFILLLTLDLSGPVMAFMCIIMGIGMAGVGMSVMHDSCHGAYSSSRKVNNMMSYTMNLLGGNPFNWKIQHNVKHHTYTNIFGADEDVDNGDVIRLSPYSAYKPYHKYQHIYSWLLYMLGTFNWATLKDFRQLGQYKRDQMASFSYKGELTKLIFSKLLYWACALLLPILVMDVPFYYILIGFFITHFVAGFIVAVVFQLAHIVEHVEHNDSDLQTKMEHSWAEHQLLTTANFSRKSPFLNWYLGGLNFQIEHHLFPHICHVHYSPLSKIIKETAEDFNLEYIEFMSLRDAVSSHYRTLKQYSLAPLSMPIAPAI